MAPRQARRVQEMEEGQEEWRRELSELRRELHELKRGRNQAYEPQVPANMQDEPVPRQEARQRIDEGGVSMFSFLKLGLPEFKGSEGEEPHEFLERIEKVVRRLPCSDARAIELVGLLLNDEAWTWFKDNIEGPLYSDHPPTWEEFKGRMMDEFLTEGEKENKIATLEQLKQGDMLVTEYAREFNKLSKYARCIVPNETAKIKRFKRGLNAPLHNALCATEFASLSKMVDKAKQIEMKILEDKEEKEPRKRSRVIEFNYQGKRRNSQERTSGSDIPSIPRIHLKRNEGSRISQGVSQRISQGVSQRASQAISQRGSQRGGSVSIASAPTMTRSETKSKYAPRVCYECRQPGHFAKDCPQWVRQYSMTRTPTVQVQGSHDTRPTEEDKEQSSPIQDEEQSLRKRDKGKMIE